jgi:hypothetical protein
MYLNIKKCDRTFALETYLILNFERAFYSKGILKTALTSAFETQRDLFEDTKFYHVEELF